MMLRKIIYLPWCIGLLLSASVIDGSRLIHDLNGVAAVSSRQEALQEAWQLLASVNIDGLCHPSSNQFAPFPKCSIQIASPSRRLENDKTYQYSYKYYAMDDEGDAYGSYWADGSDTDYNYASSPNTTLFYVVSAVLTVVCVLAGSLSTGIYVGLLSLDPLLLVVKSRTSKSAKEKRRIETLLAIMKQRHQLIATLVVTSCLAAEAMPVFLQRLVHDYVAILVSAALVLLFGEILPSVVFTGVNQLEMASRCAPALRWWICLLYPLVYPLARILEMLSNRGRDSLSASGELGAGVGGTLYNRGELAALIRIQYEERRAIRQRRKAMQKQHSLESLRNLHNDDDAEASIQSAASPTSSIDLLVKKREFQRRASMSSIDSHDVDMLEGALQLKTKTAMDICQSWHKVFCIPSDMILDETNIFTIYASGYSRVPVYVNGDRRQVRGILLSRHLMVVNSKTKNGGPPTPMDLSLHTPRCVRPDTNLADLISLFQSGTSAIQAGHMALVCARPHIGNKSLENGKAIPEKAGLMGVCTLEDVLEALLQQQIYDEMDAAGRNHRPPLLPVGAQEGMATIQEAGSYQQMS